MLDSTIVGVDIIKSGSESLNIRPLGSPTQGRIQGFHWVGAAGPGGAVLAIERAPLIDQN